ncbi:MAG: hypothetical protein B6241_09765 [Spirochaetaceae bacterium 4572_59]|nr:MAG: hypothetical protein B6241_09765 [Spirochaetaceae bacterium 4572_59]
MNIKQSKEIWAFLALSLILLFNLIFTQGFFSIEIRDGRFYGSLIDILNRAAPIILTATGMTLVIATGGIDLSVGSLMAISGAIAAVMISNGDFPTIFLFVVPIILTALLGVWNGLLIGFRGIQPFIATLILMVSGRGIAQLLTGGQILIFEHQGFELLGRSYFLGFPVAVSVALLMALAINLFVRKTAIGLFIESIGGNSTASRYVGINDKMIKVSAYVVTAICAAIAGLIMTGNIRGADSSHIGLGMELDAILSVAIGGTVLEGGRFHIGGTILGALVIQSLTTTILTLGVPVEITQIMKALVVVLVSFLQSENVKEIFSQYFNPRKKALLTPIEKQIDDSTKEVLNV